MPTSPVRPPEPDLVIETQGLRKVYGSRRRRLVAVDGLDLAVPAGGVHGFLGPNGSGKTTTLRMLLGLARPTRGTMRIFGLEVPARLPEVMGRVGAVVEEPKFTPAFSGRRNLALLAASIGAPREAVRTSLERVGLDRRARRPYASYSLGMRQRLAIAAALLKEPDLLVLDEPTNGLDPAGVRDIRALVADLAESGVTVLLSSHNLAEVQQVCQSVSIINEGRLVTTGPVDDLLGEHASYTRVGVRDVDEARRVLTRAGHEVEPDRDHPGHLLVAGHEDPQRISEALARRHLYVSELTAVRPTLESVFLRLTERGRGDAPDGRVS